MSLQAAKTLRQQYDIQARVVDLRWLKPLNESLIEEQALVTGKVLIVDEGRKTGGLSEKIITILHERCAGRVKVERLCGHDTFIPLGPAADQVLPQTEDIVASVLKLVDKPTKSIPRTSTTRPSRPSRTAPGS